MSLLGKLLPSASALLVVAGTLGAQTATAVKATCGADATKGGLAKASFAVEQARTSQGTPAAATSMTSAVKQLEAIKGEDPTVQALFLGQTLAFWLSQPNEPLSPRRGTLGFVQNPDMPIDLVMTIDSLFRVVETAKPNCVELTNAYRGGLPGYLNIVNGAINALNADQLDSADFLATRAMRLYPASPYGGMILGTVASKRKDDAKAQQYWAAAATAAGRDTIYRDVERQVLSNLAASRLAAANAATGPARTTAAREAIDAYTRLLAIPGANPYAPSSRMSMQSALLLIGDTTSLVASYQPLLANPSGYGYQDLLNSAVTASRANRSADATRLFEATLVQNPYSRDALFNLAVVYLSADQNDKVGPVVQRLIAIDPGNPENYNLAARAYLAQAKTAKAARKTALEAALNDTTMTWYTRGNKLPVEVIFNEFSTGEKQVTIAGTVTDRRDKMDAASGAKATPAKGAKGKAPAKAVANMAPEVTTLKIEALDRSGAVLGTQTVTTEPLTPGKSTTFRTTIPAANAVAYRYTVGS
jgi:tetratricopeptide (TPR) repeat protein